MKNLPPQVPQIAHQHKARFVGDEQFEQIELDRDWLQQRLQGPADPATTMLVQKMLEVARDPHTWRGDRYGRAVRKEVLKTLTEWLEARGDKPQHGVNPEKRG